MSTVRDIRPGDLCTVGNDPKPQPLLYQSLNDIRQRFDGGFLTVTRTVILGTCPVLFIGECLIPGWGQIACCKVLYHDRVYYTMGPLLPLETS